MANSLPEKILLATDGSEDAKLASRAAADLARMTGAELHVVHSWHDVPSPHAHPYIKRELESQGREILDAQVAAVRELGGDVTEAHLAEGRNVDAILRVAQSVEAEMIVMGRRGLGKIKRLLLGSVAEGVVRRAQRPVLVMRGGDASWPPARLVIADDDSEPARRAGMLATAIGGLFDIEATMVRVYPELPETDEEGRRFDPRIVEDDLHQQQHLLERRAQEFAEALGHKPRSRIAVGDAAEIIVDATFSEAAKKKGHEEEQRRTLISVGSRGLGMTERIRLGSVSSRVLAAARGPVLVYPDPDARES